MPKHSIVFICFIVLFIGLCAQDTLEEIVTFVVERDSIHHQGKINIKYPAADINNDGFTDFITKYSRSYDDILQLHFYYGCVHPDSLVDMVIDIPFDYAGGLPSYGGDLNGDGWNDLVVPIILTEVQYIYIFFGEENLVPDFDNPDIVLNSIDYAFDTWGLGWNGVNTGTDFNGDGFDDIYAHGDGPGLFFTGQVDIFFGGEDMDSDVDFHLMGEEEDWLSTNITAGDINGDGYDDLICSRKKSDQLYNYEIYLGGKDMDTVVDYIIGPYDIHKAVANGDINGDGVNDLLINNELYLGNNNFDIIPDFIFPISYGYPFYCNINNDEYTDIALCESHTIYIYLGSNNFDLIPDLTITNTNSHFARSLCNLNDFNGDGNNDILINLGYPFNKATVYTIENLGNSTENILSPIEYHLTNYPNPFNPSTTISYKLPANVANPIIEIFNIKGQCIRELKIKNLSATVDSKFKIGKATWDGTDQAQNKVSSGVYLYRIKSDEGVLISKKMLLLK
jgi:hypothetical protein